MSDTAHLVHARVVLVGGEVCSVVDVFRATSAEEAENIARALFIQQHEDFIGFGDYQFSPGLVAGITVKWLAVIDLDEPFNKPWKDSVDLFDKLAGEVTNDGQKDQDGHLAYPSPNRCD